MLRNNEIKGWLRWEPVAALLLIFLFVIIIIGAVWLRTHMNTYDHIFVVSSLLGMPLWIYLMRVAINYPLVWDEKPVNAAAHKSIESFTNRVENLKAKAEPLANEKSLLDIIIKTMKETNISYISDDSAGVLARVIGQANITKSKVIELARKHFQNKFEYNGEICYTPFSKSLGGS